MQYCVDKIKFKIPREQFNKLIKCNLLIKPTLFLKLEKVEMELSHLEEKNSFLLEDLRGEMVAEGVQFRFQIQT